MFLQNKTLILKVSLVLWIIFSSIYIAYGQVTLPKTIPNSPNATAFLRYGEIPVDISSGVPKIEIPIYNLDAGFVKIPISITYHASGIKTSDAATNVGLGWFLNAGGLVSRVVLGRCDYSYNFQPDAPKNQVDMGKYIDEGHSYREYYNKWLCCGTDMYSDKYIFNTPTCSGTFRINFLNRKATTVPSDNNIIDFDNSQEYVRITDSQGNTWFFEESEKTCSQDNCDGYPVMWYPSTWYITKVVNYNKTDSVIFNYSEDIANAFRADNLSRYLQYTSASAPCLNRSMCPVNSLNTYESSVNTNTFRIKLLKSICHKNKTISFKYSLDKKFSKVTQLDTIEISCINRKKIAVLYHSFFGNDMSICNKDARLRLDSLSFVNPDKIVEKETYKVKYNSMNLPPYFCNGCAGGASFIEDYWGYYNGTSSNISQTPAAVIESSKNLFREKYSNLLSQASDRLPNELYAKACIIESIEYPTGGKTVFEFESNYAQNAYTFSKDSIIGGLRVKRILNYLRSNLAAIKEYRYYAPSVAVISSDNYLKNCLLGQVSPVNNYYIRCEHPYYKILSNPIRPITNGNGSIVYYRLVDEIVKDENRIYGKTSYSFFSPQEEDQYSYFSGIDSPEVSISDYDCGSYSPLMNYKSTYEFSNGEYKLVELEENNYRRIERGTFNTGLAVIINNMYFDIDGTPHSNYTCIPNWWYETKANRDIWLLAENKKTEYSKDGLRCELYTLYEYDSRGQLRKRYLKTSSGKITKSNYSYSYDFCNQNPYDKMLNKNIITPIVEQVDSVDNKFIRSLKTNYIDWGNTVIAPQTIEETSDKGKYPKVLLRYWGYDSMGNPLSVSRGGNFTTSYLWGYSKSFPIAEIKNSQNKQIAYTSFEPHSSDGWDLTPITILPSEGTSGFYQALLPQGKTLTTPLLSEDDYWIEFFAKGLNNSSICINNVLYPLTNEYKFYKIKSSLSKKGSFSFSVFGSSCYLDEIRVYPLNAIVSTFTYDPMIGITSETDPSGKTVKYAYDSFGRLMNVTELGKLVSNYDYKYYNQAAGNGSFSSKSYSWTFSKNTCPAGYVGGGVVYTVPEGKYTSTISQADADAKAQAEARDKGQAYANDNGTCYYLNTNTSSVGIAPNPGLNSTLTITSNTDWNIQGVPEWLSVSKTWGSGNATITMSPTVAYDSSQKRRATLTLYSTNVSISKTIEVYQ
ncbi:DUF5977 domain-containing protein [uncultured Acetobacteroides sp.]|uniref:DUF5977 domain-containing protein n=1 Tax=uncultured Acetobacteroides sp. TaxID=1760811 RepID=UPI0029F590AE|nr:DUF5977 domain-containing protein [uncultured Acetobacteroides sp.]